MIKKAGILCLVLMVLGVFGSDSSAQSNKQVWVMYMGFWSPDGWNQRADILTDYPLERYNSADAGVAARQIEQAQGAGIDAFMVTWFGPGNSQTTAVLNTMLDQAGARGFHVGAVLDMFETGFNQNKDEVVNALNYIVYDRANHPAYVRYNGKPVIMFAFQNNTGFTAADWQEIRSRVDPDHNTIWVAEGLNGCCIYGGAMDGMYAFNVAWGAPGSTARRQLSATRRAGGTFYMPTVHPGWDETNIARLQNRPNPTSPRDRANGRFLTNSWNGAISAGTDVVLIVSWNEFMENSHIEPSVNFGTQALDVLRPLAASWKGTGGGSSALTPPTGSTQPQTFAPGTTYLTSNAALNVRSEPSTNGAVLGRLAYGEQHAVLGENNGWYMIAYNNQNGWVSGQYVTVRVQP